VRYDGDDLDVVARAWGCSTAEVIDRHTSTAYTVAFCGFAPGFAYCTSDLPLPAVPRRSEPRPRVPAGSVALAAEYCGVYPRTMPGGWQLIGTTGAVLFDPRRDRPALLAPGTTVRFEAVR
jgi:KipI family sensor histidine kinase inhibitor